MDKNKIQRMRNLVSGDYGSKTRKQSGYKKYKNKKQEGDIWEEGGRTWTLKNGIKQNIRKLSKAREYKKIPITCPKCNTPMNKSQHKFMYIRYKHCLNCQTKFEMSLRKEGKYEEWMINEVKKNFESWKRDRKLAFKEYMSKINSKHYITESGLVEDWSEMTEDSKKYMFEKFNEFIQSEEELIEELIKERRK